jgi:hypothetical protein
VFIGHTLPRGSQPATVTSMATQCTTTRCVPPTVASRSPSRLALGTTR